jgi:hypothetical protein
MATIGVDCHITLAHSEIDGGTPYGFLLSDLDIDLVGGGVQLIRQNVSGGFNWAWYKFKIMVGDGLRNPNGTPHTPTKSQDYLKLLEFLTKTQDIILTDDTGSTSNLSALGYVADIRLMKSKYICKVTLTNLAYYYPPVPADVLAASFWDSPLTWDTSYWRGA